MKRKRFSVEEIVAVLKRADVGVPVVERLHLGCSGWVSAGGEISKEI